MTQAVVGDSFQGHRASVDGDGNLYLARDVVRTYIGTPKYFPEHAVLDGDRLVWVPHPEGGRMSALIVGYDKPDCEPRRL